MLKYYEFTGVGVVLATTLTLGFFVFKRTVGTGQP